MNRSELATLGNTIIEGERLRIEHARSLVALDITGLLDLIGLANRVRLKRKGGTVSLCAIINARSGRCSEDCAFCTQSAHYDTDAPEYDMVSTDTIIEAARRARQAGAARFSIVTSGLGLDTPAEVSEVTAGIRAIRREGLRACASVGVLDTKKLEELKKAGLTRYHHNLETAPSFFPEICTTHNYKDDVETVKIARSMGLEVCCGGIFGMGESWEQRIEFLYFLADIGPDSVPMNFLNPIPGTPLDGKTELTPLDCLKIIALARLILPGADIVLCGGREVNLRDLQAMALFAGANGLMIGDYLTTPGRPPEPDRKMIWDAGFDIGEISA